MGWDVQDIILFSGLMIVAGILFWGLLTMIKGGRRGGEHNNKTNLIMRLRIIAQAIILVLFVIFLIYKLSE